MPRRRKITIRASELESFEALVRELHQRPEFAGFDPSSLHIWAYERYEPKLKDADAILRRFDYWLGVHKSERYLMANGSRLFNKRSLPRRWASHVRHSTGGLRTDGWSRAAFRSRPAATPSLRPMPFGRYWNGSDRLKITSTTRTVPAALVFYPEQNPITRQCQPKQTNAKVLKRAAACPRCGTGWRRLALICNAIRRFREGFGKPFFASSTKFESL